MTLLPQGGKVQTTRPVAQRQKSMSHAGSSIGGSVSLELLVGMNKGVCSVSSLGTTFLTVASLQQKRKEMLNMARKRIIPIKY